MLKQQPPVKLLNRLQVACILSILLHACITCASCINNMFEPKGNIKKLTRCGIMCILLHSVHILTFEVNMVTPTGKVRLVQNKSRLLNTCLFTPLYTLLIILLLFVLLLIVVIINTKIQSHGDDMFYTWGHFLTCTVCVHTEYCLSRS